MSLRNGLKRRMKGKIRFKKVSVEDKDERKRRR